jgi:hypothetical protein
MDLRHTHARRVLPRVPIPLPEAQPEPQLEIRIPTRVVERQNADSTSSAAATQTSCPGGNGSGQCETGTGSSTFTLPIVLGVVIPVVAAALLFFILHRRHVRKVREEDANDRHRSLDFGLGDVPQPGRKKKRGIAGLSLSGEKTGRAHHQVSMDMGLSSPYLLPPELHQSRESLHSLSRSLHSQEDPYRPVAQLHDGSSMRKFPKGFDAGSTYTGSTNAYSHAPSKLGDMASDDNAARMPRGNSPVNTFVPPPRDKSLSSKIPNPFESTSELKAEEAPAPPYPVEPAPAHLQMPSMSRQGLPASPFQAERLPQESHDNLD